MSQPPQPPTDLNYQGPSVVDRDGVSTSLEIGPSAGLSALLGCIPVIHWIIGLVLMLAPIPVKPGEPPVAVFGLLFFLMASAFIAIGWTSAILDFIAARSLAQRRRIIICYIAAGLACLQFPLGTTLGVFTFIVLGRPSVRSTFTD